MLTSQLREYVNDRFSLPLNEGPDKVVDLSESIRQHIKPNMSLYFSFFHSRAYAAAYEIARQFWGKRPDFEIIAAGILEFGVILIQGNLIKKVIAAFAGNTYPYPSPNQVIQRAVKNDDIELETWTNLTIPLRLMCGALNLPFMTTNSLSGSSIAEENKHAYQQIENPFDPNSKVGVIRPLNPDLALVHGLAADRSGNTIIPGPFGEDMWGLVACKKGVLVTVEHLVSTEFIRQHSHLVKVPGHLVKAVSVVPMGAHPQPLTNLGLESFPGYGEDYQFRLDFKAATRSPEKMDEWIQEWVLDCHTHDDYLEKVGRKKLFHLKGKGTKDAWRYDIAEQLEVISRDPKYTLNEAMIVCAARGIKKRIIENDYKLVLAGAGLANLAAWLVVYDLKQQGYEVELLAESGFFGYLPRPADPYVFNYNNIFTNKLQAGFIEILGALATGHNNRCLAVIGAGQVDAFGNVNSTKLDENLFIVGSGGANDLGSSCSEVVLLCQQGKNKFVDKLNYVTTPGLRVTSLYSGLGVYEKKQDDESEFELSSLVPMQPECGAPEQIKKIKESCGWPLKVGANIAFEDSPTLEELIGLRLLDPECYLIK